MKEFEKTEDYNLIYEAYSEAHREWPPKDAMGTGMRDSDDEETGRIPFGQGVDEQPVDDVQALLQHIESEIDEIADGADFGVEEGGASMATMVIIERIRELLTGIESKIPPSQS